MLEDNNIYCGDCYELIKKLPDNSVDLVLTDPPYRIHAESGGGLHNSHDWLRNVHSAGIDEFAPTKLLDNIERITKNFHAYIFCSKDLLREYIEWFEEKALNWEIIILSKANPIPTKNNKYLPDKEYCFFVRKPNSCYFNNNHRYDAYYTVKRIPVKPSEWGHPTEKDVSTIQDFIVMSTKPGDIILDPFIGSGTTAIACIRTKRQYIGIDIEQKYVDITNQRIKYELMQTKLNL